jgi:hypothetical protein
VRTPTLIRRPVSGLGLLSLALLGCSDGGSSDFPAVEGWTRTGEIQVHDAGNLWEYIDGAADLFVSYGVRDCRTADLTSGALTVTVDLYDMGAPLNAFGVFEREASGESVDVEDAVAALVSPPYLALLLRGSTYAKVNAFEGELTMETGRDLLRALARALPGESTLPQELGLLPPGGKVEGTESYQAEGFLGLAELTDCISAEYAGDGDETWQGFVVRPEAAQSVWEALTEWESVERNGLEVRFREVPYRGFVGAARTDHGLFGVSGADDREALVERLEAFVGQG